jgi:glycosyltransferase involved in cell wall biosynthesis
MPLWLLWRRGGVDAVIAYDPYASGLAGAVLKVLLGTKLIIEVNGDYHLSEPSGHILKKWMMRLCFHVTVRTADALKVLNSDQESYFTRAYPGKALYRFHDFVPIDYFRSLERRQGDYFLSVGHPFELKGMDVLIRAFDSVSHRYPGVRLRIMGYCPEPELGKYKALARNNPRIEFVAPGWIEDVGEQMRECYALINAARTEAMGKVHLEAMACAKPIIATRTNGGIACIEDGRTGLLCPIDDVDGLARQLDYLLSNPGLAAEMGRAGLRRVQQEFSEEAYIRSFLAMAEDVVRSDGCP